MSNIIYVYFIWIKRNPLFKSKYTLITDREKYCEGKLKNILKQRGEEMKLNTYKQLED